jgi:hypothetical protein
MTAIKTSKTQRKKTLCLRCTKVACYNDKGKKKNNILLYAQDKRNGTHIY